MAKSSVFKFGFGLLLALPLAVVGQYNIGRLATSEEIRRADITVPPDGTGLATGHGDAAAGEVVYSARCVLCHGIKGAGRKGPLWEAVEALQRPNPPRR